MKPLLTAAAVLAAAGGYGLSRRHRWVTNAAPELRTPQLYVPLSVRSDRALRVGRTLMTARPPGPIADGVGVRAEVVARSDGQPDVPLMVFEPDDRGRPSGALLWIHGGGLVMGTAATGQELCSRFAAELGILVVGVDYRLAPEDPFPAALDDCFDALAWIVDHAVDLGVDVDRIAVGGDSAGGGLAACLTQLALDRDGPAICFQLLEYPMLDDRTPHDDSDALVWSAASNRYAWSAYLGDRAGRSEPPPYAAAARRADLTGLPPAWIGIGDIDLFHDEAISYAERLRAAGVHVELHVEPGMYHAAEQFVPDAESMREFRSRMVVALGAGIATTAHA